MQPNVDEPAAFQIPPRFPNKTSRGGSLNFLQSIPTSVSRCALQNRNSLASPPKWFSKKIRLRFDDSCKSLAQNLFPPQSDRHTQPWQPIWHGETNNDFDRNRQKVWQIGKNKLDRALWVTAIKILKLIQIEARQWDPYDSLFWRDKNQKRHPLALKIQSQSPRQAATRRSANRYRVTID